MQNVNDVQLYVVHYTLYTKNLGSGKQKWYDPTSSSSCIAEY